jgi:hypothetical protein
LDKDKTKKRLRMDILGYFEQKKAALAAAYRVIGL